MVVVESILLLEVLELPLVVAQVVEVEVEEHTL